MTDTTVIVVSDTHINSTVALCPPAVELDDGGTYHPSPAQRWLWRNWLDFWSRAAQQPGRKIVVINGDLGELDTKRRSVQLISANKATILKMVHLAIEPALEIASQVLVLRGTPAHTGKGAWLEEEIAADLEGDGLEVIKTGTTASHYHARIKVEDVRLDIAHHAGMGSMPWGRHNAANSLAGRVMWNYKIDMNRRPPHLVIRSHNHRAAVGYAMGGGDEIKVIYTPAWSLATEYTYRAGYENTLADVGGLFVRIAGGSYEIEPVIYPYRVTEQQLWTTI